MPTPRLHPDRVQTSSERRARWVQSHLKKDRRNFNLVWPTDLVDRLRLEAATYDVSVSQLLAVALLALPEHHDEFPDRLKAAQQQFFPKLLREPKAPRPARARRRTA